MKTSLLSIGLSLGYFLGNAQSNSSYENMQNRFEKIELEPADTAAFIQAGIIKAKTLFEYGTVHRDNYSNRSNQVYVENQIPSLFYDGGADSINMEKVMNQVQIIMKNQKGKPVEIKHEKQMGKLGKVYSVNTKPNFEADLILVYVNKAFGKTTRKVWQVYLVNPKFQN